MGRSRRILQAAHPPKRVPRGAKQWSWSKLFAKGCKHNWLTQHVHYAPVHLTARCMMTLPIPSSTECGVHGCEDSCEPGFPPRQQSVAQRAAETPSRPPTYPALCMLGRYSVHPRRTVTKSSIEVHLRPCYRASCSVTIGRAQADQLASSTNLRFATTSERPFLDCKAT